MIGSADWKPRLVNRDAASGPDTVAVFVFKAFDKRRARASKFRLANLTTQVDEIYIAARARSVAVGHLLPSTNITPVTGLVTGTRFDSTWYSRRTAPQEWARSISSTIY